MGWTPKFLDDEPVAVMKDDAFDGKIGCVVRAFPVEEGESGSYEIEVVNVGFVTYKEEQLVHFEVGMHKVPCIHCGANFDLTVEFGTNGKCCRCLTVDELSEEARSKKRDKKAKKAKRKEYNEQRMSSDAVLLGQLDDSAAVQSDVSSEHMSSDAAPGQLDECAAVQPGVSFEQCQSWVAPLLGLRDDSAAAQLCLSSEQRKYSDAALLGQLEGSAAVPKVEITLSDSAVSLTEGANADVYTSSEGVGSSGRASTFC